MDTKRAFIVPHTHWDREWYLPFQKFRYSLVKLIDQLLDILDRQDYLFMLDGQTVVLEDYLEIRPERKKDLMKQIQKGKIAVGPWYLLPDEWLVGGESLIRNLEYSQDLAAELKIPLMDIAYLPDQFGHTSAIPQLLGDLTSLKTVVLWRGVPRSIMTVPFKWKAHENSNTTINGVYLPHGYGNATMLPSEFDEFKNAITEKIEELEPFSPIPLYLLMNGSDHLFPQPFVKEYAKRMSDDDLDISLSLLQNFIENLNAEIDNSGYERPLHLGEFRSPARAPLLQDTYSARMWIKQWNQKVEDMLTRRIEPLWTYLAANIDSEYPEGFLKTSWKWLLRNQPHDSICGCSVDQTHDEMRTRYSWAESICEAALKDAEKKMHEIASTAEESAVVVFSAGGSSDSPIYFEFSAPGNKAVGGLKSKDGKVYDVQRLKSREDIFLDTTVGMTAAKMGMRLLPGRKLMDFYINGVEYFDGEEPGLLELRFIADRHPVGEFDMEELKREANEILGSKKYKKIHLVAARPTQDVYAAIVPLTPWSFTKLALVEESPTTVSEDILEVEKNLINNKFYSIRFNKDGSLHLTNKTTGQEYERLHVFEDYGDRGDEYTYSRLGPEKAHVKKVRRTIISSGPLVAEVQQDLILELYASLDASREKRTGKVEIPVTSIFRFYRDSPRIEVKTKLKNKSKDHRLRICFDLPFNSDTTLTSTHYGYIERSGEAEEIPDATELEKSNAEYPEKPSGIQPQKGFIRINDANGTDAITLLNRGLPEVELADGNRLALTLLRCIGWLSRSDYPERPMHAGPGEETPGAQELEEEYEFHYGFVIHSKDDPLTTSAEESDVYHTDPVVFVLDSAEVPQNLFNPIVKLDTPSVRISSMRTRADAIVVTFYNLENTDINLEATVGDAFKAVSEVRIDGEITDTHSILDGTISLSFSPREIKMCSFQLR